MHFNHIFQMFCLHFDELKFIETQNSVSELTELNY